LNSILVSLALLETPRPPPLGETRFGKRLEEVAHRGKEGRILSAGGAAGALSISALPEIAEIPL